MKVNGPSKNEEYSVWTNRSKSSTEHDAGNRGYINEIIQLMRVGGIHEMWKERQTVLGT